MRFSCLTLSASVLLMFSIAIPCFAALPKEAAFARELKQVASAETRGDLAEWTKLIVSTSTPDCPFISPDGKSYSVKESVDAEKGMMAATKKVMVDSYMIKSFTTKGGSATAVVAEHMTYQSIDEAGEMGPKGASHIFDQRSTMTFHLISSKGIWLSKSITASNAKMLLDGKPFTPAGMSAKSGK